MEIRIGVHVECSDGPCGRTRHVILDPATEQVTHVVVVERGLLPAMRLVPLSLVAESSLDLIRLRCSQQELESLPRFVADDFTYEPIPYLMYAPGEAFLWPDFPPEPASSPADSSIPEGELAVEPGAPVYATDGHVGQVDEFILEPGNKHITHLVLRKGHLWGQRDVTVPVSEIDHIEDTGVYLKLSREQVGELPAARVHPEPKSRSEANSRRGGTSR